MRTPAKLFALVQKRWADRGTHESPYPPVCVYYETTINAIYKTYDF